MRPRQLAAMLGVGLSVAAPAHVESVYEFVSDCKVETLSRCFNLIERRLDRLRVVEQGRTFCLPRICGATIVTSESYPASVLEHVRLALSVARFGKAERPVEEQMKTIIAEVYPCK